MSEHGYKLSFEIPHEGVGLLLFSDKARQNQLCWAAVEEMAAHVKACSDKNVRVLVLGSENEGHWLEHAWLGDLNAGMRGEPTTGDGNAWFHLMNALAKGPVVTIAAIDGNTCGGGCEIGWACDLRVAGKQSLFAQPEVRLGITPGVGGASRLSKLVGRGLAGEMALSGDWTSAERLYQLGGVNRLVEPGQAIAYSIDWAQRLAQLPPEALAACKQVLAETEELALQEALIAEQGLFQQTASNPQSQDLMEKQQRFYDNGGTTAESFES